MEHFLVQKCPVPKVRLGKPNDGGYVIGHTDSVQDLFLSGGIANDISFEEDILQHFGPELSKCIAYDGTIDKLPWKSSKIDFVKQNLGNGANGTSNWAHHFVDGQIQNAFLKIDIEGHEFRVLPCLYPQMKQVKQMVLEVHTPGDIRLHPTQFKGLQDIGDSQLQALFENLGKTHRLVHMHPNNGCQTWTLDGVLMPNVFETTWVRKDDYSNWVPSNEVSPGPLDQRNVLHKDEQTCFQGFPFYVKQ